MARVCHTKASLSVGVAVSLSGQIDFQGKKISNRNKKGHLIITRKTLNQDDVVILDGQVRKKLKIHGRKTEQQGGTVFTYNLWATTLLIINMTGAGMMAQ